MWDKLNTENNDAQCDKAIELIGNFIEGILPQESIPESKFNKILNERVKPAMPLMHPDIVLDEADWQIIIGKLFTKYTVVIDGEDMAVTDESEHSPWVEKIAGDNDWMFWERYKRYMEKKWTKKSVSNLNQTAENILNLLGNPQSKEPFKRRGLIMGDVQAGKTANYTALCAKAADAGYNDIIILTGMLEDLRKQTQKRMDTELTGIDSACLVLNKRKRYIGVGKYKDNKGTKKIIKPFTSSLDDFKASVLKNNLNDLTDFQSQLSTLFVVKKNKSILENLAEWLARALKPGEEKLNRSLLVIDDEADNASPDTNKHDGDKEEDPTAINKGIRTILSLFRQTSYVGITATPFANIFINPDTSDDMIGDDLFPKDFIYALNKTPSDYVGAEKLFLDEAFAKEHIRIIEDVEDYEDDTEFPPGGVQNWFCYGHTKDDELPDRLPDDLTEALNYFLLVNAIRDVRHDSRKHRTMLVHTSRYTNIHDQTGEHIKIWLDDIKSMLRAYASKKMTDAERDEIPEFKALHDIFDKENMGEKDHIRWSTVCKRYLKAAVEPIQVRVRNSNSTESLDYASYKDGMRVIAVGGSSFSRGLTLEGLCVTYFYRRATMYDSLMQMGRWFGYRQGYEDLCRVWLSRSEIKWFTATTIAAKELKDEIYFMQRNHQAPKDFGLKVRRDPNTVGLMITAHNKMNDAHGYRIPVSLDGKFLETPRLKTVEVAGNMRLVKNFISQLIATEREPQGNQPYFWRGIAKLKVADLVNQFKTSRWHLSYQGEKLAEYIASKMDDEPWDVYIPQVANADDHFLLETADEKLTINLPTRKIEVKKEDIEISGHNLKVGSGGTAKIGLSDDAIAAVKSKWEREHNSEPSDNAYMKTEMNGKKRRPLLVLYFVSVKKEGNHPQVPDVLPALGVGFPGDGNPNQYIEYWINKIEYESIRRENGYEDDE